MAHPGKLFLFLSLFLFSLSLSLSLFYLVAHIAQCPGWTVPRPTCVQSATVLSEPRIFKIIIKRRADFNNSFKKEAFLEKGFERYRKWRAGLGFSCIFRA